MSKKHKYLLPALLVGAGIVLMVAGIYRGELSVLFTKAINICLECIGIG